MSEELDICLVSGDDRGEVKNEVYNNHMEYCERWNYDYRYFDEPQGVDLDDPFPVKQFQKLFFIRKFLDEYDYVSWMDAMDTLIMNQTLPLTEFIAEGKDIMFSASTTQWGDEWNMEMYKDKLPINGGWYIIKSTDWVKEWIEHVLSYKEDAYGNIEDTGIGNDQHGMKFALRDMGNYKDHIAITDPLQQKYWFYNKPDFENNHQYLYEQHKSPFLYEEGDFMIHFAGQPCSRKLLVRFEPHVIR